MTSWTSLNTYRRTPLTGMVADAKRLLINYIIIQILNLVPFHSNCLRRLRYGLCCVTTSIDVYSGASAVPVELSMMILRKVS